MTTVKCLSHLLHAVLLVSPFSKISFRVSLMPPLELSYTAASGTTMPSSSLLVDECMKETMPAAYREFSDSGPAHTLTLGSFNVTRDRCHDVGKNETSTITKTRIKKKRESLFTHTLCWGVVLSHTMGKSGVSDTPGKANITRNEIKKQTGRTMRKKKTSALPH